MKLDPSKIVDSAFETFPVFRKFKEFKGGIGNIEADKILTYLLWAYSKDSELASVQDLVKLKEEAAAKVGWKKIKGKYPETVQRIIYGGEGFETLEGVTPPEQVVSKMISILFLLQNSLEYAAYRSDLEAYWQLLAELRNPLNPNADDDKKLKATELKLKISAGKNALFESITKMHQNLFGNKDIEQAVKDNDLEASDRGEGVAEYFARISREGKL